jgi:hypothetical protein
LASREIEWQDRRFMEELARRGRGHFDDDEPFGPKLPERLWPRIKAYRRQEVEIVYGTQINRIPGRTGHICHGQPPGTLPQLDHRPEMPVALERERKKSWFW